MLVGLTVLSARDQLRLAHDEAKRRGLEVMRALAVPCAVSLARRELEELDAILARFADTEGRDLDIRWVGIVDAQGQVLAHTEAQRFGTQLADSFTQRAIEAEGPLVEVVGDDDRGSVLRLSMPIVTDSVRSGPRWATMTSELELTRLEGRLEQIRLRFLVGGGLIGIVLVVGIWLLLRGLVVSPVMRLADAAERLRQGDLGARVEDIGGNDQMGELSRVFNQMAEQIEGHTEELSLRVEERTKELVRANRQLARTNRRLELLAHKDGLTGLLNHRAFHETLANVLADKRGPPRPVSLIMIDVDHFKAYNDRLGHPAGDEVLRRLADHFRAKLRATDHVARYGGDEFAVILPTAAREQSRKIAAKLVTGVPMDDLDHQPEDGLGPLPPLGLSLGVATWPDDAQTASELVDRADQALYEAKRRGRGCAVVFGDLEKKKAEAS